VNYSRRDLCLLLPALTAAAATQNGSEEKLAGKVYAYGGLTAKPNGANVGRAVLKGETHSGYALEVHLTELGPGSQPHPPHRHLHEEMLMLRTGQLDVTMNGETKRISPGSVVFVASNILHGWKNPGPERAEYFVTELGSDT